MRIDRISEDQLARTFSEAFADYAVDTSYMTRERIRIRCVKNNVDLDLSVGAFDGERMVGFTLIAVDRFRGERSAFDAATGIVPGHRGRGLARRMFEHAIPALRGRGVTRFVLEVLQVNEHAVRAYRKAGFEVAREMACFELDRSALPAGAGAAAAVSVRPVDRETVLSFGDALDWTPSWENGYPAIRRIPDELLTFGAFCGATCGGVIAYSPEFNWILSLAVRRPHRRQGAGTALVRYLMEHLPAGVSTVKLINVESTDRGMIAFLERVGFRHWIDVYEMTRRI